MAFFKGERFRLGFAGVRSMRTIVLVSCTAGGVILSVIFAEHLSSNFIPSDAKPEPGVLYVVTADVAVQAFLYFAFVSVGVGCFNLNLIPWWGAFVLIGIGVYLVGVVSTIASTKNFWRTGKVYYLFVLAVMAAVYSACSKLAWHYWRDVRKVKKARARIRRQRQRGLRSSTTEESAARSSSHQARSRRRRRTSSSARPGRRRARTMGTQTFSRRTRCRATQTAVPLLSRSASI